MFVWDASHYTWVWIQLFEFWHGGSDSPTRIKSHLISVVWTTFSLNNQPTFTVGTFSTRLNASEWNTEAYKERSSICLFRLSLFVCTALEWVRTVLERKLHFICSEQRSILHRPSSSRAALQKVKRCEADQDREHSEGLRDLLLSNLSPYQLTRRTCRDPEQLSLFCDRWPRFNRSTLSSF